MVRSVKFKRQVASGYATIILLLSVPAAVAIGNAYLAAQIRESATVNQVMRLQRAEELGRKEAALTTAVWTYTPEVVGERRAAFGNALGALRREDAAPEEYAQVAKIEAAAGAYLAALDRLLEVQTTGPSGDVKGIFNEDVVPQRNVLIEALETYVAQQGSMVERVAERADFAFLLMLVVPSAAFLLAIAASIWFARRSMRELRMMYEREQKAKARAKQAVADREELQGILAHDLRSPLNAIAMQAGVIRMTNDMEQAREKARSIELVTRQMGHLMQTLLDAGRIQEGRFSVDAEPLDAAVVVREAVTLFEAQAGDRTLALQLPERQANLKVLAERERLVQVLTNLLGNALRFTPEGGTITVSAEEQPEFLCITVSDTGPGIDPANIPHLFDRYFTVPNGSSKGTGLGLYITRSIVEAHGGRIWVESEPGQGATFHFTLPRSDDTG